LPGKRKSNAGVGKGAPGKNKGGDALAGRKGHKDNFKAKRGPFARGTEPESGETGKRGGLCPGYERLRHGDEKKKMDPGAIPLAGGLRRVEEEGLPQLEGGPSKEKSPGGLTPELGGVKKVRPPTSPQIRGEKLERQREGEVPVNRVKGGVTLQAQRGTADEKKPQHQTKPKDVHPKGRGT